ncbi:MAG TPA: glycosyltransferase family 4 protein [Phycisphaerae bacterium]|nr:glycosyltransferase family 4 protein [Phycisphaerae bacterium]
MTNPTLIRKLAFIGDYLPRQCGIATYTFDLFHAVTSRYPQCEGTVVSVDDVTGGYDYPPEVRFQIQEQDLEAYRRAADFLNFNDIDAVCLQHEFGIYGGPAGSHILALLRDLRIPVITTLHTVLEEPNPDQRRVMEKLASRSARLIVMSEKGRTLLRDIYHVPDEKIDLIPHGIPDMPFVDPNFYKDQFGVEGKHVLLTFGLLSPNKGIEYVLKALPGILAEFPNTVYIVLGATHPNLVREQGESYRLSLERLTQDLGIKKNVVFYNRFVTLHELTEFIGLADIYITPYLNPAQITSGTLAYAFGCGKAVVSTPYWHAAELLADGRGVLVPYRDSEAICREVTQLLRDEPRRHAMRKRAYLLGRDMVWSNVAHLFMESFKQARRNPTALVVPRSAVRTLEERSLELPQMRLEHLLRMTDSTGLFQHATYSLPNFREGYCTDDNARALTLTVLLEELGEHSPEVERAATSYAAFLDYAFDAETRTWRNFMSFDRQWLEDIGSDDSLGRMIGALGACVGRSQRGDLQTWAAHLFEPAIRTVLDTTSPRAWAFALIGIHDYLRKLSGDRLATQVRDDLMSRLVGLFRSVATDDWPWFEEIVTYGNAWLPCALILSGRGSGDDEALDIGLRSLRWLSGVQRSPSGCFRPVGYKGFFRRGEKPAEFDQQPIEAGAMVSASVAAYRTTDDRYWLDEARLAFEWFLGRNDVGLPLYNSRTGGCCDGLHEDRVNQNQGAESTLSWLTALAEMRLLEGSLAAYDTAVETDRSPHRVVSTAGEIR